MSTSQGNTFQAACFCLVSKFDEPTFTLSRREKNILVWTSYSDMPTGFITGSTGTLDTAKYHKTTKIIAHKVVGNTIHLTIKWADAKMGCEAYSYITKSDIKVHNQGKLDEYWESCGGRERATSGRE